MLKAEQLARLNGLESLRRNLLDRNESDRIAAEALKIACAHIRNTLGAPDARLEELFFGSDEVRKTVLDCLSFYTILENARLRALPTH
jgi:hypothetical protein